jgi:D-erythronate 2-dehydrogenase
MKLLITGGAGFVGARLARALLARDTLAGRRISQLVLADQAAAPADLLADARVEARVGPLLSHCEGLKDEAFDGVFHLASAVSGECEADFDLGLRSNLDSTRALLDALRARVNGGAAPARLVFSSSVAVFGPDAAVPLPEVVADDTLPAPQTSYGTQKLICEHLVADYTRKGYIDGRAARLMTVTVRPGRPNGAASSFFSGIIREPLAGVESVCPVAEDVSHPVSSPTRTVQGLMAVFEASREAFAAAPR